MPSVHPTLVIAAFEPELAPLSTWGKAQADIVLATCGIGMVEAAATTAKLIHSCHPAEVLFIGSAGSVNREVPLLSLFGAERVSLADSQLLNNEAYLPETAKTSFPAQEKLLRSILSLSQHPLRGSVYTPAGISRGEDLGTLYSAKLNAYFENLELFGVAAACAIHDVPWGCLSCVTNYIGKDAHAEWQENVSSAAQLTSEAVEELLS